MNFATHRSGGTLAARAYIEGGKLDIEMFVDDNLIEHYEGLDIVFKANEQEELELEVEEVVKGKFWTKGKIAGLITVLSVPPVAYLIYNYFSSDAEVNEAEDLI